MKTRTGAALGTLALVMLCAAGQRTSGDEADVKEITTAFEGLSIDGQIETLRALRGILDRRLLEPDPELVAEHSSVALNRLLNRGSFEGLTVGRGGGAYFSFTTQANDYDREPDLQLSGWSFSSGFSGGDDGFVEELPGVSLDEVTLEDVPERLLDTDPNALDWRPDHPEAQEGQTYVVRSIRWDESDLLAAFKVLERDDHGITFGWRVLKRFEAPERRR